MSNKKINTEKMEAKAPVDGTFTEKEAAVDDEAVNRVIEKYKKQKVEKEKKNKEDKESVNRRKSGEEWMAMAGDLWDPLLDSEARPKKSLGEMWGSW